MGANEQTSSLAHQMGETKERIAAWSLRGLSILLTLALTVIGYLIQDKLGEFNKRFETLDAQRAVTWKSLSDEASLQRTQGDTMIKLETTMTDHIATENSILQGITSEARDHEQRLRDLEKRP